MAQPTISVIVPVYNAEPYLNQCLDSLLSQTYVNLQILLVDDGSTDRSGQILEDYAVRDSRITVIRQENRGVSAARNAGLDAATGEWIGWVDADDWVEAQMFARLLQEAEGAAADMVICGRFQEYPDRSIPFGPESRTLLTQNDALQALLEEKYVDNALYDKLYRRHLFEGIRFPEGKTYEDLSVLYRVFEKAEKILMLPDRLYHYRQNPKGIVGDIRLQNRMNHFLAARSRLQDLGQRRPEYLSLLQSRCVTASVGLWTAYYRNPKRVRQQYRERLREVSRFCAPLCHDAEKAPGLGLAGRLAVKLIPHPDRWAYFLALLIGLLYERKHGRTL